MEIDECHIEKISNFFYIFYLVDILLTLPLLNWDLNMEALYTLAMMKPLHTMMAT